MTDAHGLFYLHGIVAARDAGAPGPGLRGMDALGAIRAGDLAIVYTDLLEGGIDQATLEEEITSAEAGETLIRDHQRVLCQLRDASGGLLPFPFCTLYHQLDGLVRLIHDHRATLNEALSRVAGAAEWSVRLVREEGETRAPSEEDEILQSLRSEIDAAPPGRQFLLRCHLERELKSRRRQQLSFQIESLHEDLSSLARDAVQLAHSGADAHRRTAFKGAYLVADADRDLFLGRLDDRAGMLAREGWQTVVQGPWPAYSFSSLEAAA